MHDTLLRLFRHKAWANDELLTVLTNLGEETSVSKLAIEALSHTHIVDRIFAAHLRGADHEYDSTNLTDMPKLHDLAADIRASDQEYLEYIWGLDQPRLAEQIDFRFTDGAPGRMSRDEMLMHVITHGIGHRGQISAVMLLNSVPPAKDGFSTYLHHAEALTRGRATA